MLISYVIYDSILCILGIANKLNITYKNYMSILIKNEISMYQFIFEVLL